MRVLITGVFGYLGARIAKSLKERGLYVIGLSKNQNKEFIENDSFIDEWYEFDVLSDNDYNVIEEAEPDVVIHLVSLDHTISEINHHEARAVNFESSCKIIKALESIKNVNKVIYISTIHVYAEKLKSLIGEEDKIEPKNMYALTHYLSELAFNYFSKQTDVECYNLRLSNSYGEPAVENEKCWNLVVNNLCQSAVKNKKIVLKGNGMQSRDFIHYETICDAIEKIIKLDRLENLESKTFNLCSDESIQLIDVAKKIRKIYKKIFGEEIKIFINEDEEFFDKKNENKDKIPNKLGYDISKIEDLIKIKRFDLDQGITRLLNHLK